jgi:hypothetical protein
MPNTNFFTKALRTLCPNSGWVSCDDDYDKLVWTSEDIPKPTKEEIEAEMQRLQAEYDHNEYQRLRAIEYPSFADQFDLLYHGGYDAWKAEINKVKQKYPKP